MKRYVASVSVVILLVLCIFTSCSKDTPQQLQQEETTEETYEESTLHLEEVEEENDMPPLEHDISNVKVAQGILTVTLEYKKQTGSASNQYAVWIEDYDGDLVKTLYVTEYTADGGYKNRPDSIFNWVKKSNLVEMSKVEVDAISGATPNSGIHTYSWDVGGAGLQEGRYIFVVEGTLRWKNYVIFKGDILISDAAASSEAEAEYFFEATERAEALNEDSIEVSMIDKVKANFIPAK